MHLLTFIVFLPLLAAIVAGLGGRWIGKTAAKAVTTGALFIGAFLSWPIFFHSSPATRSRRWFRCSTGFIRGRLASTGRSASTA